MHTPLWYVPFFFSFADNIRENIIVKGIEICVDKRHDTRKPEILL